MTNRDIERVLKAAADRSRQCDQFLVRAFLDANEILATDPKHKAARRMVDAFLKFMDTGEEMKTFAPFVLLEFKTVEELAAERGNE